MKRIKSILALIFLLSSGHLWAQDALPYKPAAAFEGDTAQYLEYNYAIRRQQYIGKTVGEILQELEYPAPYIVNNIGTVGAGPAKLVGLSFGVKQIGEEPSELKDYYVEVRFETPLLFEEYMQVVVNHRCPVLITPEIYDFIKDLKLSSVCSNQYIIKDPEILRNRQQAFESFQTAAVTVKAQIKDSIVSPKREQVEVKEGNLSYLLVNKNWYERPETRGLKGKTYQYLPPLTITPQHQKQIIIPIIHSVFSEERAKQLADLRLMCTFSYSPVENKILHFQFILRGHNNDIFPLKLAELNDLELKFRAEPKLIPFRTGSGDIIEGGESIVIPIRFDRLYE